MIAIMTKVLITNNRLWADIVEKGVLICYCVRIWTNKKFCHFSPDSVLTFHICMHTLTSSKVLNGNGCNKNLCPVAMLLLSVLPVHKLQWMVDIRHVWKWQCYRNGIFIISFHSFYSFSLIKISIITSTDIKSFSKYCKTS